MVRSHSMPLEQVINRYEESMEYNFCTFDSIKKVSINPELKKNHNDGPLIEGCSSPQFKFYSNKIFSINVKSVSNCYIGGFLNNDELSIMKVYNICYNFNNKKYVFICRVSI